MATIQPQIDRAAGVAGQSDDTILPEEVSYITGDFPHVVSEDLTVLDGEDLSALHVVGFDGNDKIVEADPGADPAIPAIGIMSYAAAPSGADATAGVFRTGVFNPDLLVWPAWYDTDAKKAAAFRGAPSPTQIFLVKPTQMGV